MSLVKPQSIESSMNTYRIVSNEDHEFFFRASSIKEAEELYYEVELDGEEENDYNMIYSTTKVETMKDSPFAYGTSMVTRRKKKETRLEIIWTTVFVLCFILALITGIVLFTN